MVDEERIRRRAHEIWQRENRPGQRDKEHWEQARREIEAEQAIESGTPDEADIYPVAGGGPAAPDAREIYDRSRDSPGATGETIPAAKPARKPRRK